MKAYKSKQVKTEESLDKSSQNKNKKEWIFRTVLNKQKKPTTPLRFADVFQKKCKDSQSTNDRQQIRNLCKMNINESSISKAISVLKDLSAKQQEQCEDYQSAQQQSRYVTPFTLTNQIQGFQQELTFKGASNRLYLLSKIDQIQKEAAHIFSVVKILNHNSSIDFITFKLLKSNQQDLKQSYYDFYSHLEVLTRKINDFITELARCRQIMAKIATGISKRTMDQYINKFEGLSKELKRSVEYLQHYVKLLNSLQRQEKRTAKKYLTHMSRPTNSNHAV